MVDILRPDYGQVWASEGEKVSPAEDKVKLGWVQEMMPFQWENFLQARQDEAITYLLQKGIPEYAATQEYTANKSVVQYQGNLYLATATVTGVLPTVTASWRRLSPTLAANGTVSVAGGGTGATGAAQARANLGLGDASTATLPTTTGVVVKGAGETLISRLLTGTSGDIVITNPDGVAGNINVGVGSNVAKTNQDSSWTSNGGITLPKGSSGDRGVEVPGKIRYNTELQKFEGYDGTSWNALGATSEIEITTLSGDGTTTVFTLNTPAFSEASTDVYVGGVWQNKGTYSVSGTQITFSEAPPVGVENVQVISRKVTDLGLARASQISLEDSANLITATTVEGALREIVETSGTITASAEWGSVPSHTNHKLDLQAQALANMVEFLRTGRQFVKDLPYRKNAGNGMRVAGLETTLGASGEPTGTSIINGCAWFSQENTLYATLVYSGSGSTEQMRICKYKMSTGDTLKIQFTSQPTNLIGHQSLAITREQNRMYLWTIDGSANYSEKARHIVKFRLNEENGEVYDVKRYRCFGDEYVATATRAMGISPDYGTLVVFNNLTATQQRMCRVFKTDVFTEDAYDVSDKHVFEFQIGSGFGDRPIQDIATDGELVYVLHGATSANPTSVIEIYTISGELVMLDGNCEIAKADAEEMSYFFYEPEALLLIPTSERSSELHFVTAIGKSGGAGTNTPHINLISKPFMTSASFLKSPAGYAGVMQYFQGGYGWGFEKGQYIRAGSINPETGEVSQVMEIKDRTLTLSSPDTTGTNAIVVQSNGQSQAQFAARNGARSAVLQVSLTGNVGLFANWEGGNGWLLRREPTTQHQFLGASTAVNGDIFPQTNGGGSCGRAGLAWSSFYLRPGSAPASATATGSAGEVRITNGDIYVCVAENTWKRAALTTW